MTTARYAGPAVPSNATGSAEPEGAGDGEQEPSDGQVSRRQWVRGAAIAGTVVAAGVGLAACSTSTPKASGPAPGSVAGTSPTAAPTTTTTTTTTAPTPTTTTATADTPADSFPAIVVTKTSAIPVGGGVVYATHGVVVTQPTAGTFKCFSSSCTHQGCTVNKVAAGLIQCPCHGAKFSIVDGSVKAGPATRPLTAQDFTVKDGVVGLD